MSGGGGGTRVEKARTKGFICLRRGYVSTTCGSGIKCSRCNNRHHVSICLKRVPDSQPKENPTEC